LNLCCSAQPAVSFRGGGAMPRGMDRTARAIVHDPLFQNAITLVILFAAVVVGIETYPSMVAEHGDTLHKLDKVILGIFTLEIVLKLIAEGKKPWRYFTDPWNVFDFAVVVACFLPIDTEYATVLRVLRLLRALRLVRALPRLQILVAALLKAIPSMGYVSLFLMLHFYVFAVAGVFIFGENDPVHFASLQVAVLTLFTVVTMEGWADVMYTQMYGCAKHGYDNAMELCTRSQEHPVLAPVFFIGFILLGTMVILNLFIGVIMNSMQEAQEENLKLTDQQQHNQPKSMERELVELEMRLDDIQKLVAHLKVRAQDDGASRGA
jgi:voltage-gated sodium channel